MSKLDDCMKDSELSNKLNIHSTQKVIEICSKYELKIIYFSSEFVFDGEKGLYSEDDRTNPINLYGKQKLAIENYLKKYVKNYCILRIAKTYNLSLTDDTLFAGWYNMIFNKNIKEITCFDDQYFSPLFVGI